ncbi:hypothetical protein CNMCM6106_002343 [Aspergillus hiratsukae]|uniref:Myb-like domain-containing protein n=1 Tax=Aspergillus hiratsukae TaxID=1194566 RepID=A0A8H6Q592_9EURO|nr:hypothetical protein CNMCM6106_002343 [Aspergillus hiratsukae]
MDCAINLSELESGRILPSPREVNLDVQDALQSTEGAPNDPDVLLAAVPSDESEHDTQVQPRQEPSLTHDGSRNVPVHAIGLSLSDQAAPISHSHAEIRNCRPLEETRSSVEILENTANIPGSSCCHPRSAGRSWRLDGSILSIDLQHAEFPIGVGKSSFHVFDGQVIQTLTVVHGPYERLLPQKPASSTKTSTKKRKLSCSAAAAGPLSSEQKQYLLELKDQGYTWNEIVAKFPGRKKGTLQAIFYTKLKNLRNPASRHRHGTKRSPLATRSSGGRSHTQANTIGSGAGLELRTENEPGLSRYSLRSREVLY